MFLFPCILCTDYEDIIDETLLYFRANVLFRNFDVRGAADRTLIYASPPAAGDGLVQTIIEACAGAGLKRLLLFGGGYINAAFYEAGVVDEFIVTICPVMVGSEQRVPIVQPTLTSPTHFSLDKVNTEGNLVFVHYIAKR